MNIDPLDLIRSAYLKTRSSVYYDKGNFHTRLEFASSEDHHDYENEIIDNVHSLLNPRKKKNKTLSKLPRFLDKLELITKPKSFSSPAFSDSDTFHTNIDWDIKHKVEKVNYFIDCPAEIHVLSTLWVMGVGALLEELSSEDSYGWTLHSQATNIQSKQLFKYYVPQYSSWRDQAIKCVRRTVQEDDQNATLVGLDIKEFYYHIDVDWDSLDRLIQSHDWGEKLYGVETAMRLNSIIKQICARYRSVIEETILHTHPHIEQLHTPLPLGISFSPILANWVMDEFDSTVREELNPVYYGRYVDDLLFVISSKKLPFKFDEKHPRDRFLNHYFVKRRILEAPEQEAPDEYHLCNYSDLIIQKDKIQIQHFDANGSLGALDRFETNIKEIVSEFRLLPESVSSEKLEALSYHLHYKGSKHSLRSVHGFECDQWQLSNILTNTASTRLLSPANQSFSEESKSLLILFTGRLGMKFYDMWEKLMAVLLLGNEVGAIKKFYWERIKDIKLLEHDSDEVEEMIQQFYLKHLNSTLAMTIALAGMNDSRIISTWNSFRDQEVLKSIKDEVAAFRESNLVRHHYVGSPLINFTNDNGDWTRHRKIWLTERIDPDRIENSPRFLHLDELDEAEFLTQLSDSSSKDFAQNFFDQQFPSEAEVML